jgi:hypothetical protein
MLGPHGRLLSEADVVRLIHALKHEGPPAVLTELRMLTTAHPDLPDLPKCLAYLEKREAHMQDPLLQAAGWPIGSGMVESANKLVVEARLKGAGMHWAVVHGDPMLALRKAVCNDRWGEVWRQIAGEQRRQAAARWLERQQRRRPATPPAAPLRAKPVAPLPPPSVLTGPPSAIDCNQPALMPTPADERKRPAANHPWKRAWSMRRQRELASAA